MKITHPKPIKKATRRKSALDRLNTPWLALMALAGLLWLGWYSQQHTEGYDVSVISEINEMSQVATEPAVYLYGKDGAL